MDDYLGFTFDIHKGLLRIRVVAVKRVAVKKTPCILAQMHKISKRLLLRLIVIGHHHI